MTIKEASASYEKWLSQYTTLLKDDLVLKHKRSADSPFIFFRATFYRWMQLWRTHCSEHKKMPEVLSVGDLHLENFGTWRDQEGRLVWGINDFDEAHPLPFTNDLLRLSVSAYLAIKEGGIKVTYKEASTSIINGYYDGLLAGGKPFVLEEKNFWLRSIAVTKLKEPAAFWEKLNKLEDISAHVSNKVLKNFQATLPSNVCEYRVAHRVAGLGSLGHQRYIIMGNWNGAFVGREAKAIIPSACSWASGKKKATKIYYSEIVRKAVRCPDPYLSIRKNWLVRRMSPSCSRIEIADLPKKRDEQKLLYSMGFETANIHLGAPKAQVKKIISVLKKNEADFLHKNAVTMMEQVMKDWKESLIKSNWPEL